MREDIKIIVDEFCIGVPINDIRTFGGGHINDTYLVEFSLMKGKYILQNMNGNVFHDIDKLMENICNVTAYLKKSAANKYDEHSQRYLEIIPTMTGSNYYSHTDGSKWRMMNYIDGCCSYDIPKDSKMFEKAGYKFGEFIQCLEGYDSSKLNVTIPDFHNTAVRYKNFEKALELNICDRARLCVDEINFAVARKHKCDKISTRMREGAIPLRVTHNDTKLNNLLIDIATDEPICVIDLDTIMSGSLLFDYGDAIRSGCNSADEDEKNLELVHFDYEMFEVFTRGFIGGLGGSLTANEKKYFSFAARQMTYECGIRFLTDFLNGDTYFKTDYPEHNLVRCRTQFKLVKEMEDRKHEMKKYIASL